MRPQFRARRSVVDGDVELTRRTSIETAVTGPRVTVQFPIQPNEQERVGGARFHAIVLARLALETVVPVNAKTVARYNGAGQVVDCKRHQPYGLRRLHNRRDDGECEDDEA